MEDDQFWTREEDVLLRNNHGQYKAQELLTLAHTQELDNVKSQTLTRISDSNFSGPGIGSYF